MSKQEYLYVVVYSTSHALKIETLLKEKNIPNKLIPVPRHISSDCGVCVRVPVEVEETVKQVVEDSEIEIQGIFN